MAHSHNGPERGERLAGGIFTCLVHVGIAAVVLLSTGSEAPKQNQNVTKNAIFCRYIENGRLFRLEVDAKDWQEAEEKTCGAQLADVRMPPLLAEGARLILDGDAHPVLLAQRESCSCSDRENIPILKDVGIVEAPRLGAETRKTALPRIINTPEPSADNTVTTQKTQKKDDRPRKKAPTLDELLNAASTFDEARPVSDVDPGGSADGSRLSKSATGQGDPYLQKVKAKLDNTMNAPASIPKSQLQKLSAKIWIKIGDNGTVWSWDFVKKSGNAAFDKMIDMTIRQFMMGGSLRFASPPQNWRLQTIPILVDGSDIR